MAKKNFLLLIIFHKFMFIIFIAREKWQAGYEIIVALNMSTEKYKNREREQNNVDDIMLEWTRPDISKGICFR